MEPELESYLSHRYWPEDEILAALRRDIAEHTSPIAVNAEAGKLLGVLVRATGASRILEVGTLFGYSAICMARALPSGGRIDTVEMSSFHADSAAMWFRKAGVEKKVTIHRGPSSLVLPKLEGPYDLAFLDGEKTEYVSDAEQALRLLRPGGLLVADNVLWGGRIIDRKDTDPRTDAIRQFHAFIANHDDLLSTVLPVGDGLALAVKAAS